MAFIQSCFIQKCTQTLIEELIALGYKISDRTSLSYGIFCNNGKIKICSTNEQPSIKDKNFIQCYDNEDLFLALAAMKDDTDKHQWFVLDTRLGSINYPDSLIPKGSLMKCMTDSWNIDLLEDGTPNPLSSRNIPAHKANTKELLFFFQT